MKTHDYFAYGRNTNAAVMRQRCPQAQLIGAATLLGYSFRWRTVADIELAPGQQMQGVLWQLTDADLEALDRYEGFPKKYFRQRVICNYKSTAHTAWAYMMVDQSCEAVPKEEYHQALMEGYVEHDLDIAQLSHAWSRLRQP